MRKSERAELLAILVDLQIRIAKISGTAEYLADVLGASDDDQVDRGVLLALSTRHAFLVENVERLQGHLWPSPLEDQSSKTPTPDHEAPFH